MQKTTTFLLKDSRHPLKPVGSLVVTETGSHKTNNYMITIDPNSNPSLTLKMLMKNTGKTVITGKAASDWVSGRAFPPDRQNMKDHLKGVNLTHYDAWDIVKALNCKAVTDHLYMEKK